MPEVNLETIVNWNSPSSIVAYLDQYVIGQTEAKKCAATVMSNYLLRRATKDATLPKENMLFLGSSGSGKTYIISKLIEQANLPYVEAKVSGKSSSGLVGENLAECFYPFFLQCDKDDREPYGVIFFDEIDKLAFGGGGDISHRLQNELIGWIEGAEINQLKLLGSRLNYTTKNILFVFAGAFQRFRDKPSLAEIIAKREEVTIKKGEDPYDLLQSVLPEDLIEYGLIPELVGRMPAISALHTLSVEDRAKILLIAKNSPLQNYAKILSLKGFDCSVEKGVAELIASHCAPETGARGLNRYLSLVFREILYDPASHTNGHGPKHIRISKDYVEKVLSHGKSTKFI